MSDIQSQPLLDQLALEHEAVWTYSLIGARWPELTDQARAAWTRHQRARDAILVRLAERGSSAPGPQAGYDRPVPESVEAARALAVDVERRLGAAALATVRVSSGAGRRNALQALEAVSRAAIAWGDAPRALPGLADQD